MINLDPEWVSPARTALLIVDAQVDFARPEGAMGRAGADLSDMPAALAAIADLAGAARRTGVLVVFAHLATRPESDSTVWAERIDRRGGRAAEILALCREGTAGAAFAGPAPRPGELVIAKRGYSAFFGTGLDKSLKERGVDTLVLAGLTTECCIDSTAREAFHLDYHVFIAADACAGYDRAAHTAALAALDRHCAILIGSAAAVQAWSRASKTETADGL